MFAFGSSRRSAASLATLASTHLAVGALASLATYYFLAFKRQRKYRHGKDAEAQLAGWLGYLWGDTTLVDTDKDYPEWHSSEFRAANGWKGNDFIHSETSNGPRILRYFRDPKANMLIGAVVFGPDSESHAGLCHGGSMTAVLDDVLGHVSFMCGGKGPWSGATVSVNCTLKKPVAVNSVMKVWGRVVSRTGRKVVIEGGLESEDGTVHALLEGMAVQCTRAQLLGN
eukprot:CAMPEP_0171687618 /NCGR_PEP_ID=MMETSP0991-20121206/3452_1 /TAXON_ID=483369 /ORGANISM="non described non described, Strain CCMP2098" /LENGTH=226 /DNA_ID=CAMNT_0012275493 /DNA_START=138 /DNA_END=818 /DNA_ORIENTATION=-